MPLYETDSDRANEELVAGEFKKWYESSRKIPVTIIKNENTSRTDRKVFRDSDGHMLAIVEIKYRHTVNLMAQFPTVIIDEQKVRHGRLRSKSEGCEFYFAIGCDSGYYVAKITDEKYRCTTIAPRDDYDIEPVYHIPVKNFVKIE